VFAESSPSESREVLFERHESAGGKVVAPVDLIGRPGWLSAADLE
jgi:hypothetical protein